MSREITLQQAAERAHQIEVICALAEDYRHDDRQRIRGNHRLT